MRLLTILVILCTYITLGCCEDQPCLARDVGIEGRSIVCVCNANYCDTITRETPDPGTYVVYTTSNAGQRFEKSFGVLETDLDYIEDDEEITGFDETKYNEENADNAIDVEKLEDEPENTVWNTASYRIYTNTRSQYIEGFGGSVTDAASINWRKLSDATQTRFINSYFGSEGLEYNMIRVPIAGADFSTHPYTYNELPWNDGALSNFSLTEEDLFYKLPMIKRSQRVATDEIKITASTWSPPIWMKTNERITGFGQLKPEFYQSYADYHIRFMEEYEKAEVKIWAITTTNEPLNGIIPLAQFNSLGMSPSQMARWVANNLGPTVRNSRFNQTLIIAVDDQRYILPIWIYGMEKVDPTCFDYIDGFAVHYYGNFIPANVLSAIHNRYPNKILLSTEACEGAMPWHLEKVEMGSWRRARRYITSILDDLNNFVVGWIDWNLCLDEGGGPNWANNFVDAAIIVYGERDEFVKQPMFYAMGHFSKFIPRGSRRIRMSRRSLLSLGNVAFLTPQGNIVIVLHNTRTRQFKVTIYIGSQRYLEISMEPQSVKTIEINPN